MLLIYGKGIRGLDSRLKDIKQYVELVLNETIPPNHDIMNNLQVIFSLLPNMNIDALARALSSELCFESHTRVCFS